MADNKLVKSAGEHWTCAVLARFGWAAALTRDGVERTDVLAAHPDGQQVSIQVKTTSTVSNPKFMVGAKGCEPARSSFEWFVLVALPSERWGAPRSYVVPRDHVSAAVWIRHTEWLTNPSVPKGRRNTPLSGNRTEAWIFAKYEERWDLLALRAESVPVMLPPRFKIWSTDQRVMLPEGHPWIERPADWDTTEPHPDWLDWSVTTDS